MESGLDTGRLKGERTVSMLATRRASHAPIRVLLTRAAWLSNGGFGN